MEHALLAVARWIGLAHEVWRTLGARRRPLGAEIDLLREQLEKVRIENDLLRSRLLRLNAHARPHYRPWERLRILWHRARFGMSLRSACRAFVITLPTLCAWLNATRDGLHRLVRARRPLQGISDLAREIAWHIRREWPRWGTRRIAGVLARLGVKASRTSVQRMLRRPPKKPAKKARLSRPLPRARRPRHIYVIDFTVIRGLFRSVVVGSVMDLFSRKVLALRVAGKEPSAAFARALMKNAVRRHGKPGWIVSDQGTQFRADLFKSYLHRQGIRHRWGAVGRPGAPSLDRWWRTLKEEYARGLALYLPLRNLERRLLRYATWYNSERPHTGLKFRSPDEVFCGTPLGTMKPVVEGTLTVRFLARDRRLPTFRLRPPA